MKKVLRALRHRTVNRIRTFLGIPPNYIGNNGCLRAAASFAAWNQIPGDYLEFGVWQGDSFSAAHKHITHERANHIGLGYADSDYEAWKRTRPRFFAFDSFAGIPDVEGAEMMVDYQAGSYSCSRTDFLDNVVAKGVPLEDVVVVQGFYEETCSEATRKEFGLEKAAVVMIDCDLYESTVPVLEFLTSIVQQGTIIVFDDWFRFKGNPNSGEQRACREWLERNPHIELIEFWREGPQAVSFVVNLAV